MQTTEDLFQKQLHAYTITHAIEDGTSCASTSTTTSPKGKNPPKPGETLAKRAVVEAILAKHDAATGGRRFNALLATASINDAIEYHDLFKPIQAEKQAADPDFQPLNIACVFSPPAEGNADVKQIQEDLPQEKEDNEVEPEKKKAALKAIIADYNARYGTNHTHRRVRPLLPGRAEAHQGPAVAQCRLPARARRSTSPSSSTCCSPASTPST